MVSVVLIDNHDSFTWNLYQLFDESIYCKVEVISNDRINYENLKKYDKIVFSPGPDIPKSYPQMNKIINEYAYTKSILGICLGHQALIEHWGGNLLNLSPVSHGKKEKILINNSDPLFKNLPESIEAGLYHSWAADERSLPGCFSIIAKSQQNIIMGISHKQLDIKGIQFHPESYMTFHGKDIIENWIRE
ncbi:MAG: aminodeoxychorismate/anthranilate synthase component II [Flavobacteriaceae bacterium]|jgi:anthranilate synthase/aminodeoxychorismate synthase-like glutamine amidotransferase|nr:aminodeoxychorismate/anthranilate synthase component II [Flavobacteriaceae bacterium]